MQRQPGSIVSEAGDSVSPAGSQPKPVCCFKGDQETGFTLFTPANSNCFDQMCLTSGFDCGRTGDEEEGEATATCTP